MKSRLLMIPIFLRLYRAQHTRIHLDSKSINEIQYTMEHATLIFNFSKYIFTTKKIYIFTTKISCQVTALPQAHELHQSLHKN